MPTPFVNRSFVLTQPDGERVQLLGSGGQDQAVFETRDGYTVVQDPETRFYVYAVRAPDGSGLLAPSGRIVGKDTPGRRGQHLRQRPASSQGSLLAGTAQPQSAWQRRRSERLMAKVAGDRLLARDGARAEAQVIGGTYVGLCLPVDFSDDPATIAETEVTAFFNRPGYSGFGNNGSVFDYFRDVSEGKLHYTNIVLPYYRAKQPKTYYADPRIAWPRRASELVREALAHHKNAGVDFSGLSLDPSRNVYAVNVLYAGGIPGNNGHRQGLWPHQWSLSPAQDLGGRRFAADYQICEMGRGLTLGTVCHENGHMICDFPDLYDVGGDSKGVGMFCLMGLAGHSASKNPAHPSAYLKYQAGWISSLVEMRPGTRVTLRAGKNEFAILSRSDTEYFIVENRARGGRDAELPGAGLAIWHVDENGNNEYQHMTARYHYECSLLQADGENELEFNVDAGDGSDLYRQPANTSLSDATQPHCRWWDGSPSGLRIERITRAGPSMSFDVR